MSEIMTCSKKMFDPLRPKPELIDIADIAHSLSMLCRANGHFQSFYSVGQHCINCANEAIARGYSRRVQLACLLHDASEAYLSDVTRPVKQELPMYKQIEEPLQALIWEKYLGAPLTEQEDKLVFLIDDDILENEFPALMGAKLKDTVPQLASRPQYAFTGFETCQREYLELFEKLMK
jgi:hypothetical protein